MSKNPHTGSSFDDFLKEEGIYEECTATALKRVLAWQVEVPKNRIYSIINEQRSITADTAIRLGIFFQQTPDFWLNLQKSYELDVARQRIGDSVKNIVPYQPKAPLSAQMRA